LSIGLASDSPERIMAGIKQILSASRDFGHCYLTESQIVAQVEELLIFKLKDRLPAFLKRMEESGDVMVREIETQVGSIEPCYYSKSLYFDDELYVAKKISNIANPLFVDKKRVESWINRYCNIKGISLSDEQAAAVKGIVCEKFSILTGGPGCGKTTTTLVLVKLLEAMKLRVLLAAPTGRAAQRMMDVIGRESCSPKIFSIFSRTSNRHFLPLIRRTAFSSGGMISGLNTYE
jgi:exodeoxyribonuclease V alpha subunit